MDGRNRWYQLSLDKPILVPVGLLLIAWLLRILDIFVLPVAESTGEAFLHKALGFGLVLAYLWAVRRPLRAIGLHARRVGRALWISGGGVALILILGFGLQWIVTRAGGEEATLVVAAADITTTGLAGGAGFALFLIAGNLINSFMEEGLVRGVMLPHFRRRLGPWRAVLLQALLFGLWHVAWPIKHLITGEATAGESMSEMLIIVTGATINGLAWGYLFLKTDSLWAPWLGHTINNTVLNLVHVRTAGGDYEFMVLYMVIAAGYLALLPWTKLWAKQLQMPELQPWGASDGTS